MTGNVGRKFEEYLTACVIAGSNGAFERLVKHWQPRMLAYARRMTGDDDLALDVVQDAWIDIYRGLPSLGDTMVFPAWAYRIVNRRAVDAVRKNMRKRRDQKVFDAQPEPVDVSSSQMEAHADRVVLSRAMGQLPAEQRAVIAMFYVENFSVAEIAYALQVPAGTVKTRLMHGRRKLRAVLEGET